MKLSLSEHAMLGSLVKPSCKKQWQFGLVNCSFHKKLLHKVPIRKEFEVKYLRAFASYGALKKHVTKYYF